MHLDFCKRNCAKIRWKVRLNLDTRLFKFLVDNFDYRGLKNKLAMNIYHLKPQNIWNCKIDFFRWEWFDDLLLVVFSYQQAIELQTEYQQLEESKNNDELIHFYEKHQQEWRKMIDASTEK